MKKLTVATAIMLAMLAALLTPGCRVAPSDWALDAQWQLMRVEYADGTVAEPQSTYYCFYRHTANLYNPHLGRVKANLAYVEDESLTLEMPYITYDELPKYYLPTPADATPDKTGYTITFAVEQLTDKRLVLVAEDSGAVYTFRKY